MNFLINRRITISMLFIALTLLGYVSYKQLAVELLPNAERPTMYVQVTAPNDVDPSYLESQAIVPLEGAVSMVDGVEKTESWADSRSGVIVVSFKKNVKLKFAALRLQERVNEAAAGLPDGFGISISQADVFNSSNSFMGLQVRGSGGVDRVRNVTDKEIKTELEKVDGVAGAEVYGGRQKAVEIRLDPGACKTYHITPATVSGLLAQNSQERAFVGQVSDLSNRFYVHVDSHFGSVSEIENIVVAPGPVLLKDVASVFFDLKDEQSYSRVNGKAAVQVNVVNDAQSNQIELSHRVLRTIDSLNLRLAPLDVEIIVQNNSAETIEDNIDQIIDLALVGGLLAVFILWFFLKNIRLVLLIALSIPISVYAAFNLFYAFDITINSLTLIGMALAIGMLLDNSVVVLENIYRLSGAGYPPDKAVTQGTREVWRSILAATLTTVTVFLPFLFSDNYLIKLIGLHIGVSIIATLGFSLLVALLLIPMATYTLLRAGKNRSVFYEKISVRQRPIQIYITLLKSSMRHPVPMVIGAFVVLAVLIALTMSLDMQGSKEVNADRFNISVSMRAGSTLEATDKIVRQLEDRLGEVPEKKDLICQVEETKANLTLILQEDFRNIRGRKIEEIKANVQQLIGGIENVDIRLSDPIAENQRGAMSGLGSFLELLGIGNNQERIVIKGTDFELMEMTARDLGYYVGELECVQWHWVSSPGRQPELRLNFDPLLLTSYEISRGNLESGLMGLNTETNSRVQLKVGTEDYDIIVRQNTTEEEDEQAEKRARRGKTVEDLRAVQVPDANGGLHDLQSLTDFRYGWGISRIRRVDRDKQIEIYYAFDWSAQESRDLLESYRTEIDELVSNYNLPNGVAIEVVHEESTLGDFNFLILAAFIFIFMILASVFESVVTPFVLLFTIPLAAIGALAALLLAGQPLSSASTYIGFLILLGVVVNNGIILIDYANVLRTRGYRRNRALVMSGLSRIRPILITSITTIVAMLPMAMGRSEYAGAIGAPFAITVIGGLSFSALLTLIFIPTVCVGLENMLAWYRKLSVRTYIVHGVLFVTAVTLILLRVHGMWWRIGYLMLAVVLIPGVTYFAQTSLRRARTRLIAPDDDLVISIRNLVKIYDWQGRFARQWVGGIKLRHRLGLGGVYHSLRDFVGLIWQVGMLGFLIYFTYFYLESGWWIFVFSFAIYAIVMNLWNAVRQYIAHRCGNTRRLRDVALLVFWGLPLVILYLLSTKLSTTSVVVVIGLLWMLALAIRMTSDYLYGNNVNIERVEGRWAGFRRWFFRFVKSVPVIGRQRRPFKALKGVSFDIHTGMFGLLGPNGAGKSTLMRIVCGILEQSYGTIWVNGLDTKEYREELQSLIGFLPQEFGTYENMSSWDFLDYQAMLKGITDSAVRRERIEYVLKAVHMYERRDAKIGSFSGGMKQRIGIALILLHLPRILIVDEPTAGLDPRERIRFRNLLVELSKDRIVIFSTHIIEDIASSCNQVAVINKGELKYYGEPNDMVHIANGKIWQFDIDPDAFERQLDKSLVVHHIQDGTMIRVRYIAEEQPYPGAVRVEPNLEDAYLCLLKNM
ncbi:MAG: efflux RND transporter permease subunit [Rikenellaceae bacterium]|nr:efflux RND transporter permease subunit [Rikenellaceae bacterium]